MINTLDEFYRTHIYKIPSRAMKATHVASIGRHTLVFTEKRIYTNFAVDYERGICSLHYTTQRTLLRMMIQAKMAKPCLLAIHDEKVKERYAAIDHRRACADLQDAACRLGIKLTKAQKKKAGIIC